VLDQWRELEGKNAALYYPWLGVSHAGHGAVQHVPPCGHVAGLIALCDRERGFFSVPANQPLAGVLDVETLLTDEMQKEGDPYGVVNCIRAFPGRGIRLWGAHTISGEANWRYVNVRRLFLTLNRWLNTAVPGLLFESNTPSLWARLRRTIGAYLADLHRRGGLAGAKPEDAFFVYCDQSTTPADMRDKGQVVVEIGIAPLIPAEFIVVKLIVGAGDVVIGA
jgi:phage tail sheath protein FI